MLISVWLGQNYTTHYKLSRPKNAKEIISKRKYITCRSSPQLILKLDTVENRILLNKEKWHLIVQDIRTPALLFGKIFKYISQLD